MKVEIIQRTENPLLRRTEIKFKVDHTGGPTPPRKDVRAQLAAQLGVSEDLVIVEKMASLFGRQQASGIARVYDSRELLEKLEPRYLLKRNFPEGVEGAKPKAEQKVEGEKGG